VPVQIEGWVAPGYERLRDAVASCGPGVTVAASVGGQPVVDLWTGPLSERSLVCTWSAVKPATGACLLLLIERGRIGLDDHVVSVWPELADDRLLVRHLLSHAAGRITVPDVPLTDWDATVTALAAMDADWPAGAVVCEHAQTFGFLVGELVRRIDGRSLGQFLAQELAGPLSLDISIGVGDADLGRVADTVGLSHEWWAAVRGLPGSVRHRSLGPWPDVNEPAWRQAELPAVNGHATARGLAAFWQAYLDGRLPAGVGEAGASGHDRFVDDDVTWTLAGGRIEGPDIGMGGLGGQWGAARPARQLAWAFLTTHVAGDDDRAEVVEAALVAAAEGAR
jgi:CubicO group peptidase (beta-lactamase class C family)